MKAIIINKREDTLSSCLGSYSYLVFLPGRGSRHCIWKRMGGIARRGQSWNLETHTISVHYTNLTWDAQVLNRDNTNIHITSVRKLFSQSKFTEQIFTPQDRNKFSIACTNYFSFASGGTIHVTPTNFLHFFGRTVFTHSMPVQCACRTLFSCASACADAIQTRLCRQKMLILYSQKFHRTKVPSS